MKILYIITKTTSGGAQTHISQCAAYMKSLGHDVAVMANPGGWLEKNILDQELLFLANPFLSNSFNPISGIRAMRAISEAVSEFQPDIVSCHSSAAGFWGRIAIHNRVPTIFTAHGWGFGDGMGFIRRCVAIVAERLVSMFAKKIITVSEKDRLLGLRYYIASRKKLVTIHNGVEDLQDYVTSATTDLIKIVWVGRFVDPKKPETLLEAFKQLPVNIQERAYIEFVGDGEKRSLLESMIVEYNLEDKVYFLGDVSRQEVFQYVGERNNSNTPAIFVLTSDHEGFPRSILEAMSLGCVVIASDVGGVKEALHNDAGIIVEPGNSNQLAKALTRLIDDPILIKEFGGKAREIMQEKFTLQRMLEKTYAVYNMVLARSRRYSLDRFIRWLKNHLYSATGRVIKGGLWFAIGKGTVGLISFGLTVAFAHWLSKETYGTYQYVLSVLAVAGITALQGVDVAIIKSFVQGKDGTYRAAFREKARWGSIGAIGTLLVSIWYFLHGDTILGATFLIGAIFVPFRETFNIFISFWNGRAQFAVQAKYAALSALLNAAALLPALYFSNNVAVIIGVFVASRTLADWFLYRRTFKNAKNNDIDSQAIGFGRHLSFIEAIETASQYLDKIVVWKFLGPVSVAVYSFAQVPMRKVMDLIPIMPLALATLGNKNVREIKQIITRRFFQLFLISIPIAVIVAIIAKFGYTLVFPQYLDSIPYFQALSVLIALSPFILLNTALVAEFRQKDLYIVRITAALLKITLFFVLIPLFGLWGMIAAIITAEVVRGMVISYYFMRL